MINLNLSTKNATTTFAVLNFNRSFDSRRHLMTNLPNYFKSARRKCLGAVEMLEFYSPKLAWPVTFVEGLWVGICRFFQTLKWGGN